MKIELKVDGTVIKTVTVTVDNPDYNHDNIAFSNDFEDWVKDWFGVED
jgi:hypothetical protein